MENIWPLLESNVSFSAENNQYQTRQDISQHLSKLCKFNMPTKERVLSLISYIWQFDANAQKLYATSLKLYLDVSILISDDIDLCKVSKRLILIVKMEAQANMTMSSKTKVWIFSHFLQMYSVVVVSPGIDWLVVHIGCLGALPCFTILLHSFGKNSNYPSMQLSLGSIILHQRIKSWKEQRFSQFILL